VMLSALQACLRSIGNGEAIIGFAIGYAAAWFLSRPVTGFSRGAVGFGVADFAGIGCASACVFDELSFSKALRCLGIHSWRADSAMVQGLDGPRPRELNHRPRRTDPPCENRKYPYTDLLGNDVKDKGLIGTLLRYPYEVRDPAEYFDETQDVKVTKDMLDLARHIVEQKAGRFEPDKFEDQYETALVDLINQKRAGKRTPKERPRGENVVDLMEALRKSVGGAAAAPPASKKPAKKSKKAASGQKEMLMPIAGKKPAKEAAAKKPSARPHRKSA
jgi:hypothetical protein